MTSKKRKSEQCKSLQYRAFAHAHGMTVAEARELDLEQASCTGSGLFYYWRQDRLRDYCARRGIAVPAQPIPAEILPDFETWLVCWVLDLDLVFCGDQPVPQSYDLDTNSYVDQARSLSTVPAYLRRPGT